jgi:hypothetical protein
MALLLEVDLKRNVLGVIKSSPEEVKLIYSVPTLVLLPTETILVVRKLKNLLEKDSICQITLMLLKEGTFLNIGILWNSL